MKRFGLIVLALAACDSGPDAETVREGRLRDAFVRGLAARDGYGDAWSLVQRQDARFADGFSNPAFVDPAQPDAPSDGELRGRAARWMSARSHLRLFGRGQYRLHVRGVISLARVGTRPQLELALDGAGIQTVDVAPTGGFELVAVVPVDGWSDAYLTFSSVGEPGRPPDEPRVARLEYLGWDAVGP